MTAPRCDHKHWHRIGDACGPCFTAHWSAKFPVGTYVTYDDEGPLDDKSSDLFGVIAEPTVEELEYVKTYPDPVGPDAGDLLVQWGVELGDRSWVNPMDLRLLDTREDAEVRAYVSRLWAADWDSPEDAVYDDR